MGVSESEKGSSITGVELNDLFLDGGLCLLSSNVCANGGLIGVTGLSAFEADDGALIGDKLVGLVTVNPLKLRDSELDARVRLCSFSPEDDGEDDVVE